MIKVERKPEPSIFNDLVRKPGLDFLSITPYPNRNQWNRNGHWKNIRKELYSAYRSICAYSGEWVASPGSVDHYIPKSIKPRLAYEWENYRLSSPILNNYKGNSEGVIDPFSVEAGWFVLELPSCLILPGKDLGSDLKQEIYRTIEILRLNKDDSLVQNRCDILVSYSKGFIQYPFLELRYPYIAFELMRQGVIETVKSLFRGLG